MAQGPLIVNDRVLETSSSTGTGNFTLAGAVLGYRAFSSVASVGNRVQYVIEGIDGSGVPTGEWEAGIGTYSAANTLTRTKVKASSNAGAAVNFSAGTKRVMTSATAAFLKQASPGYSPPFAADFTLENAGGSPAASITDTDAGMLIFIPNTGSTIRFARYTAGPTSFTAFEMIWKAVPNDFGMNSGYYNCAVLRNSANSRIVIWGDYQRGSQWALQRWSSYTAFNGNISGPTSIINPAILAFPWRRITVAAGVISFDYSPDGVNFRSYATENVATYLTAIDQVGLGQMSQTDSHYQTVVQSFTIN